MKTLEKQDCFQAFHVLAGQAKNGEIDLWEYTMTLYSVENHEYSRAILIQPVLQLTAKKISQNHFFASIFWCVSEGIVASGNKTPSKTATSKLSS